MMPPQATADLDVDDGIYHVYIRYGTELMTAYSGALPSPKVR